MEKLKAFHGDKKVKAKYLRRVKRHAAADQLIQGTGWEEGKGCAVGCTLHAYDHALYPIELGIPEVIARLEDCIFEGSPNDLAMMWPTRFLAAIPVGADLSKVWPRFAVWLMARCAATDASGACARVGALYARIAGGGSVSDDEWAAVREAAEAAEAAASWAASWAAAEAEAAEAAEAARAAAEAAEAAAAEARQAFWIDASETLLSYLSAP